MWDGSSWSALGDGVDGTVYALALAGSGSNDLIVGGAFTSAGSVRASRIAKWDGSSWSALGGGVDDWVLALTVSGSKLFVGGQFKSADGVSAEYAAKWDFATSSWSSLGDGLDGKVLALAVSGSDLFVGGFFAHINGDVAANSIATFPIHTVPTTPAPPPIHLAIPPTPHDHTAYLPLLISVLVSLVLGVSLTLAQARSQRIASVLRSVDSFTLDHHTHEGESPVRRSTAFGGAMSVAMVAAALGVAISTAISIFVTNKTTTSTFVPDDRIDASSAVTEAQLVVILASPAPVSCNFTPQILPRSWTAEPIDPPPHLHALSSQTGCAFHLVCEDCSFQNPLDITISFPPWFLAGSWSLGVMGSRMPNGTTPQSLTSGTWTTPGFFEGVVPTFAIATSPEVIVEGGKLQSSTGFSATLASTLSQPGSTEQLQIIFRIAPSGQVFLTTIVDPSIAAGLSTVLGGVVGVLSFFRANGTWSDPRTYYDFSWMLENECVVAALFVRRRPDKIIDEEWHSLQPVICTRTHELGSIGVSTQRFQPVCASLELRRAGQRRSLGKGPVGTQQSD
jgi:hypothetical protein